MTKAMTVAVLLIASAVTSCATTPSAPATEKQRKARTDLEQCAGDKAELVTVTPEGKYSFQVIGLNNVDTILTCMASKGYSGKRLAIDDYPSDHRRRYSAEGEPSR